MIETSQRICLNAAAALGVVFLASCGKLSMGGSTTTSGGASPGGSSSSSDSSGSSSGQSSSSQPSPAASGSDHDRFVVLDLKIGMPVDVAGFTCAKHSERKGAENRHCVKFVDPRCEGQATNIGELRYGEKAPLGCFFDYSGEATFLDGTLQQTPNTGDSTDKRPVRKPLMNVHIIGTQSRPSKIHTIWYMLGFDELTEDSKLYKSMTAKYGEPSYKNPPNEMRWKGDTTQMKAWCDRIHCEILVEDQKFEDNERDRQEEADAKARRQNAGDPKL